MGLIEDERKQFKTDMEDVVIMLERFAHLNKYAQYGFIASAINKYCELNHLNYKKVLKEYCQDMEELEKYMDQFIEL